MVYLLGQGQHIAFVIQILALKVFKELLGANSQIDKSFSNRKLQNRYGLCQVVQGDL